MESISTSNLVNITKFHNNTTWPDYNIYPQTGQYTYWIPSPTYSPGKLCLTLEEIEVLRAAASDDEALRDILNRLAQFIEIKVEF